MKLSLRHWLPATVAGLLQATAAFATNPLIVDQFTADPTARVFEGKVYVYPSHDIKAPPGYKGKPNWFVMEDYHVFSSENLTDWKDHGVILKQTDVEWADPAAYAMWAPDSVFKDGKYYFYFPAIAKTGGFRIGVAIADKPYGPFKPEATYIEGVKGIDPAVLIGKDGSAYLYYSLDKIFVAKLKPNMLEIEGEPIVFDYLPKKGLQEGPFVFERNGLYYLTYPHVANKTERLEYATSTSPLGPFKHAGVILDEAESGCWTVHHSILDYRGQWYLFYHDKDLSPAFDKNRAIRADKLFFNSDGTIRKVTPTLRGVGLVDAKSEIQIDRYSATSGAGVAVSFLDEANPHAGWKTTFSAEKSWVRFNEVDFERGGQKSIAVRAKAPGGGALEIRLDKHDGPVIGRLQLGRGAEWNIASGVTSSVPAGVHDLFVTQGGAELIEVDWVSFR
ncbi:MAG TPA: family 43 glycosylhydrolase [Steroidobacter sp.]|uniref:family 43 glycosylhydrolase n=1 Tax=Steroidobacter sp. TaxID=1978227 RepID=UPI002EDA8516